jgi:hypothetical protein
MMNKEMIGFLLVFVLLIGASVYMGNADMIAPTVAQAQAGLVIGETPVQVIKAGASWVVKLLLGAVFTGIAAAAFTEIRKAYKVWKRNGTMRRWQAGPNAQWQQQAPRTPSLTRADLFTMLLAGRLPENNRIKPQLGTMRTADEEEEFGLEF